MTAVFGWLAAILSMTLLLPQVWLSCARRRTQGLSAAACWLVFARSVGWLSYALLISDVIQIVTNTVVTTASLAIIVALLATQPTARTLRGLATSGSIAILFLLVVAATVVAVLAVPGFTTKVGVAVLGSMLAVSGLLFDIPQPVALLRDRYQDVSGLSATRWWMTLTSCALWTAYGVAAGQPALWVSTAFGVASSGFVCGFLAWRRWIAPVPVNANAVATVWTVRAPVGPAGRLHCR